MVMRLKRRGFFTIILWMSYLIIARLSGDDRQEVKSSHIIASNDRFTIWSKSTAAQFCIRRPAAQFAPAGHVPQPQRAVIRRTEHLPPIWAERAPTDPT